MIIHAIPIQQRIDWLIHHVDRRSQEFKTPKPWLERSRYHANHPTDIVTFKCMDGRINIPVATNTPYGIILPFRNLVGRFHLGWPHLGEVLSGHVQSMVVQGRSTLALVTYHYSKGDPLRGCAGFNFDTDTARSHTFGIQRQVEAVFGTGHGTVYPLVCGFETDEDAIVLHCTNGEVLDLSTISSTDRDALPALPALLARLYPDMPDEMRQDLLPLVRGNIAHIGKIKQTNRKLNIEHREWMICIGRGFASLHMPNLALIIGPYRPDLTDPIHKAAGLIEANMRVGRIPDDSFLLLAETPSREIGVDHARTELKSRFLSGFAADVIRTVLPKLAGEMHVLTAVLNWQSRAMDIIDGQAA